MTIQFNHVGKRYRTGISRKLITAVSDLTLNIESGEIFGIIGPNGAGKSTLLKMLMGFIQPSSGNISVLGSLPSNPKIKRSIGYLPENPYYYDHLSAEELMRFSALTSDIRGEDMEHRINQLLETMSLTDARKRKLRSYSKGMTQRAGICFALVHDPKLVILDEPMSGLDPVGRKDVVDLVLDLKRRGKTVLFCSHILNDVQKLCDRMAIMSKGQLRKVMTREEIKNCAQKVELTCRDLPERISKRLDELGAKIRIAGGQHFVDCTKKAVNDVLCELKTHNVHIEDVKTSEDTLETLFFETIQGGTLQ